MAFANTTPNTHAPLRGFSLVNAYSAFARFGTRMQVARMTSVLRAMSQEQLNQIGVKRSEIAQHAELLITGTTPTK